MFSPGSDGIGRLITSRLFLGCSCPGICNFKGFCEVTSILMLAMALLALDPVQEGRAVIYVPVAVSVAELLRNVHLDTSINDTFIHVGVPIFITCTSHPCDQ